MSANTPTPVLARWRELSGLTIDAEKSLQGRDRRAAIRKLHAAAESEIRAELQLAADDAEYKSERTFLWEPIPAVCRRLEISQSVLTRLLKELTGMSATQLADKIRAEGLKEKLRAELIAHVQKFHGKPGVCTGNDRAFRRNFWEKLKGKRTLESFSYATRAIALGFANYTRLYRSCLLQYGLTPMQLEDEILRDIAEFFCCAADFKHRESATQFPQHKDPRFACYRKPYNDNWAQAVQSRPDWLAQNQNTFGLAETAAAWM